MLQYTRKSSLTVNNLFFIYHLTYFWTISANKSHKDIKTWLLPFGSLQNTKTKWNIARVTIVFLREWWEMASVFPCIELSIFLFFYLLGWLVVAAPYMKSTAQEVWRYIVSKSWGSIHLENWLAWLDRNRFFHLINCYGLEICFVLTEMKYK